MSCLVYAITIPFFLENYLALPFAVAVQSGLMWLVYGAVVGAPVAIVHAFVRTAGCTIAYLLAPQEGFWLQPLIVVACYAFSIPLLERRWQRELAKQQQMATQSIDGLSQAS